MLIRGRSRCSPAMPPGDGRPTGGRSGAVRSGPATSLMLAVLSESIRCDRLQGSIALKGAPAHQGDQDRQAQAPQAVDPAGPPHHPPLRLGPVLATGQQPDVGPLQHRRQVPVLRLGVPERRPFRQPQLGPAAPGLPLLAGQPVAQRRHQVVVGELVVTLGRPARRGWLLAGRPSGSVGVIRRSSPSRMRIRSSKSAGRLGVARGLQQLGLRPHVALDVGARFGQQGLEDRLGRLLVQAVLGVAPSAR